TLENQEESPEIILVAGAAAYPEQLYQHDCAAHRVAIRKCQPRPGCAGAQIARRDRARLIILLLCPRAAHVADQTTVAAAALAFAGGGVEVDPFRRYEQSRECVEQG